MAVLSVLVLYLSKGTLWTWPALEWYCRFLLSQNFMQRDLQSAAQPFQYSPDIPGHLFPEQGSGDHIVDIAAYL